MIISFIDLGVFQHVEDTVRTDVFILLDDLLPARIHIEIEKADQLSRISVGVDFNIGQQLTEAIILQDFTKQRNIDRPFL